MNLTIPPNVQVRPGAGDLDFADLAPGCKRSGPATWLDDGTLVLPFAPEPTSPQQALIRRRVLTKDAREERIVAGLVAVYAKLDQTVPVQQTARLLIEDRVGRIEGWQ
ncbi:MAG: hypothetical protein HOQ21_01355 [Dermatophilaceae bacterium]|nr:hypothetical protein [Dermatophilaceae bacterium]